jgi:hypothetical protein
MIKKPGKNSNLNPSLLPDSTQLGLSVEQTQPPMSFDDMLPLMDEDTTSDSGEDDEMEHGDGDENWQLTAQPYFGRPSFQQGYEEFEQSTDRRDYQEFEQSTAHQHQVFVQPAPPHGYQRFEPQLALQHDRDHWGLGQPVPQQAFEQPAPQYDHQAFVQPGPQHSHQGFEQPALQHDHQGFGQAVPQHDHQGFGQAVPQRASQEFEHPTPQHSYEEFGRSAPQQGYQGFVQPTHTTYEPSPPAFPAPLSVPTWHSYVPAQSSPPVLFSNPTPSTSHYHDQRPDSPDPDAQQFEQPTRSTFRDLGRLPGDRDDEQARYSSRVRTGLPGIRKVFVYDPRHPLEERRGQFVRTGVIRVCVVHSFK